MGGGPASTLPPPVGRSGEVAGMLAALESVGHGRMAAMFLTGDAGVGKTRLVQELVGRAEQAGATVLLGAALDIAESPPFWPVASALRALLRSPSGHQLQELLTPWAAQLDELVEPGGLAAAGAGAGVQTLELLHAVIRVLAQRAVVVLVLEDLQWVDRSTRDLLSYLIANLTEERVLVIATYRSDTATDTSAVRTMISELGRHRQVRTVHVAPLSRSAIAALVQAAAADAPGSAAAARPDDLVDLVWNRSAGNAFIAEETLRAALHGDPTAIPTTLRELVASRLGVLTPPAKRAVRAIGLCDGTLPHRLLETVLDDERDLLRALREGVDAGVVAVERGLDDYRLRHGLMTDVVVDELLPGERLDLHRRYAAALESPWARGLPGVDARVAHHWYAAGEIARACAATVAAAQRAVRVHGYAEAHRHWLRAARRAGGLPDVTVSREECLERAAEAAHLAGDADQAVALLAERLTTIEDRGGDAAALLHARTGQYLVAAGRGREAALAYGRATALLPASGADRERAEVLGGHAAALSSAGDFGGARAVAELALEAARRTGLAVEEATALTTLGFSLAYLEDPEAGKAALRAALAVAEKAEEPGAIGRAYRGLAELLSGPLNEMERGIEIARDGAERARALGLARSAGVGLLSAASNGLFRLGRWDEAMGCMDEAWALAPSGDQVLELRLARARLHIGQGRFAGAEDDLEAVDALSAGSAGPRYRLPLLTLRAGLAMFRLQPDVALDHVAAGLDVVEQGSDDVWLHAPLVWHGARARAELTRLGVSRPDDGIAERLRRHAADLRAQAGSSVPAIGRVVLGFVEMCDAEDSRAAGRSDAGAWARVVEIWRAGRQPYPTAYALLRRAEALLDGHARSADGAHALREAARMTRRFGAEPLFAEIADLAERARVPLDDPADLPDPADLVDPDERTEPSGQGGIGPLATSVPTARDVLSGLTERELEILLELRRGRSNREIGRRLFIADKTVGVHLGRVYAKLGVRGRLQAVALLYRSRPDLRDRP